MAVTVTVLGTGTALGAVYSPVASIVPTVVLPPTMLLTERVKLAFVALETTTPNFCTVPMNSEAVFGLMVTVSCGGGTVVVAPPPPPPPLLVIEPGAPQVVSMTANISVSRIRTAGKTEVDRAK